MKILAVRMLAVSLLSSLLAAGLSILPTTLTRHERAEELAVFQNQAHVKLSKGNLVDFLMRLSFHLNLLRTDVKGGTLFLELATVRDRKDDVAKELMDLIESVFLKTENIGRLQLMVHLGEERMILVETNRHRVQAGMARRAGKRARADLAQLRQIADVTFFSSTR